MMETAGYQPNVLADTTTLSRPEWLEYRRRGLGGSDAAAVLGISPFRTARDLYYDKTGVVTADSEENWVALEVGNLLEPLVAKIFSKKTGLAVYQRKRMFQHPSYPWMLADLDYLVDLPDGTTAIVEIKTTNYNAQNKWWYNGAEIVPVYYESQGRHYMAVMNLDRVFFCCLYGNNEDETIIRCLERDRDYEAELIALEEDFWQNNVLARNPPPYTEDGDLIMESLRRTLGPADTDAPPVTFSQTQAARIMRYLELQEERQRRSEDIDRELERLKALIAADLGTNCTGICENGCTVTWKPSCRTGISKENLLRLKAAHPEIYREYVTTTVSRRFSVKQSKPEAA